LTPAGELVQQVSVDGLTTELFEAIAYDGTSFWLSTHPYPPSGDSGCTIYEVTSTGAVLSSFDFARVGGLTYETERGVLFATRADWSDTVYVIGDGGAISLCGASPVEGASWGVVKGRYR
jgi:hypothetical protein